MVTRRAVSLIALLLISVCAHAEGEKIDLKIRFQQGQTFKLMLTQSNSGAAAVKNQSVSSAETMKLGLIFNVESVDAEGTGQLRTTFDNPTYSVTTTGQPGAAEVLNPISKAVSALNGRSFHMEVTCAGAIRSLAGLTNAATAALDSLAGQPEGIRQIAALMFARTMDEAIWKDAMSSFFALVPPHPVAINERWSRQYAMSSAGGGQQGTTYYKITDRTGGVCKVKVYDDIKAAERTVGPNVKLTFSGTSEGNAEIEESTGLLLRSSYTSNLKGKAGQSGMKGDTAPVAIRTSVSIARYQ